MTTLTKTATNNSITTNVVLNDNANAEINIATTALVLLTGMEEQRIKWEDGVYRKSNAALYEVLAECLQFAGDLTTEAAKERTKALEAFYTARKYKLRKDTPLVSRVLRAVFGDADRRRISTYSIVLREAKNSNVAYKALANWIEVNGGIQEIKLERSPTFVSAKQKSVIAQQSFDSLTTLAEVKTEALSLLADADFVGEDCVLLAQQQADGSFAIRAVLRSGVAVNAAFTALYAQKKTSTEEDSKERTAANDADGSVPKAA
jgi:hypothetical protein